LLPSADKNERDLQPSQKTMNHQDLQKETSDLIWISLIPFLNPLSKAYLSFIEENTTSSTRSGCFQLLVATGHSIDCLTQCRKTDIFPHGSSACSKQYSKSYLTVSKERSIASGFGLIWRQMFL